MAYRLKPISATRICYKCKQTKPIEDFHKQYPRHDGTFQYARRCKVCACAETRAWQAANYRRWWGACLRHQFGITVERWWEMLIAQSGRCALCEKPMTQPMVDHDHKTGRIRGLLCRGCNTAVGYIEGRVQMWDDRLAEYLR